MQQSVEQYDVHDRYDGQAHGAYGVEDKRDSIAVDHYPSGHPGQGADTEGYVRTCNQHTSTAINILTFLYLRLMQGLTKH